MKLKTEHGQPVLTYCEQKLACSCFDKNITRKNAIEAAKDYNVPVQNVRAETCSACLKLLKNNED